MRIRHDSQREALIQPGLAVSPIMMDKSIAVVMLHGACDMRCTFCITENHIETMTAADYEKTLQRLHGKGFRNIVIGGGEPLCWGSGVEFAACRAQELGFYVQVGTNGVRMTDQVVSNPGIDRFVLPLDAAEAASHNQMRRMKSLQGNHHELILSRLRQLRERQRSVTVSTVVSRANLPEIVAVGDILADYVASGGRLHAWHLYCFIPKGRGGRLSANKLAISTAEFDESVRIARSQHYPYIIYKRPDMRHSEVVDFFWFQDGRLCAGSEVWGTRPSESRILQR